MALAVVTGANRGIGLELTRQLVARGDEVPCQLESDAPVRPGNHCQRHHIPP